MVNIYDIRRLAAFSACDLLYKMESIYYLKAQASFCKCDAAFRVVFFRLRNSRQAHNKDNHSVRSAPGLMQSGTET